MWILPLEIPPCPSQETTKTLCQQWLFQSAEGVRFLHANDVVHRDIRSKNCLLTTESTLKISDFGISKITDVTEDTTHAAGCRPYIAPEIVREKKFSKASDIFALGFLFWEIHTKEIPVLDPIGIEENMKERHSIPNDLKSLMISCWELNYHKRPKIEEVLHKLTATTTADPV